MQFQTSHRKTSHVMVAQKQWDENGIRICDVSHDSVFGHAKCKKTFIGKMPLCLLAATSLRSLEAAH